MFQCIHSVGPYRLLVFPLRKEYFLCVTCVIHATAWLILKHFSVCLSGKWGTLLSVLFLVFAAGIHDSSFVHSWYVGYGLVGLCHDSAHLLLADSSSILHYVSGCTEHFAIDLCVLVLEVFKARWLSTVSVIWWATRSFLCVLQYHPGRSFPVAFCGMKAFISF